MQNTDCSNTETTLDVRLTESKVFNSLEIRVPGDLIVVTIFDSQKIENIKIEIEKEVERYMSEIFGIHDIKFNLSDFVKSYLLSSFATNWVEEPFWNRRYLELSPIVISIASK